VDGPQLRYKRDTVLLSNKLGGILVQQWRILFLNTAYTPILSACFSCLSACIHTYIKTLTYIYIHTYILIHTHAYITIYTYTHTYIHTYILAHTYIATVGSPSFRVFSSDRIPSAQKDVEVVAISVNSTSEFREVFEATTYFGVCDSNLAWIIGRCSVVT
jgi:hypothetical protein